MKITIPNFMVLLWSNEQFKTSIQAYLLYKSYNNPFSSVLYIGNRIKYENRNIIFYGLIGDQLTLSKQEYMPIYFTNLTTPHLTGFCMLEIEENMKIAISYFLVILGFNQHFKT